MKKRHLLVLLMVVRTLAACGNEFVMDDGESPESKDAPASVSSVPSEVPEPVAPEPVSPESAAPASPSGVSSPVVASPVANQDAVKPPAPVIPPDPMLELLKTYCTGQPAPRTVKGTTPDGRLVDYTEIRVEEDSQGTIADGKRLYVDNLAHHVFVFPSSDATVSWAARKWVLDETEEKSKKALANSVVISKNQDGEAQVIVDHPSDAFAQPRYRTCLVVKAPAEWSQILFNTAGDIKAVGNTGSVSAETGVGNVTIQQQGYGVISAMTGGGSIKVESDSRATINLKGTNASIDYTLWDGGVSLQNAGSLSVSNGTVVLHVDPRVGLRVDALTEQGKISVPVGTTPAPVEFETTGESLSADLHGGGATLTIRSDNGSISIADLQ